MSPDQDVRQRKGALRRADRVRHETRAAGFFVEIGEGAGVDGLPGRNGEPVFPDFFGGASALELSCRGLKRDKAGKEISQGREIRPPCADVVDQQAGGVDVLAAHLEPSVTQHQGPERVGV
ncbi:hypothetical protein D3C72_777950 [compost metagenome]